MSNQVQWDLSKKLPTNRYGRVTTKKGHIFHGWCWQEDDEVSVSFAESLTSPEPEWSACVQIDIANVDEVVLLDCPRCGAPAGKQCKRTCGT